MSRGTLTKLLVVCCALFCASCWGRSVWADYDAGPEPLPGCGNDRLEGSEECDGVNLAGYTCEILGFQAGTLGCTALCQFDTTGCSIPLDCGNGVIDSGEECDTANLGGENCLSQGYAGGTLSCGETCQFNTSMCQTFEGCGNGVVDPGESCDDANTAPCDGCDQLCRFEMCGNGWIDCGEQCDDGNSSNGDGCSSTCQNEYLCGNGICEAAAGENCGICPEDCCGICGNNQLEPEMGEECDGPDHGGTTCHDFCYSGGSLDCNSDCSLNFSGCYGGPVCGDGIAECEERCDLFDLGGESCQSLGYSGGTLGCSASCTFDTGACTGQLWYLYEDFEDPATMGWSFTGDWEWGIPVGIPQEPPAAYDGAYCIGTRMGAQYSDNRAYLSNLAISPPVNLTAASNPELTFYGWIAAEQCCDGANVWVKSTSSTVWTPLQNPSVPFLNNIAGQQAWTGTSYTFWTEIQFDLSAWAGQTIQVAFSMYTDGSVTHAGAYVDQVVITEAGAPQVSIVTPDDLGTTILNAPFARQLQATGGSGQYDWSIQPGGFNYGWLQIDSNGLLSGVPGAANAGPVEVAVRAAMTGNPGNFDERWFWFDVVQGTWQETFDGGSVGWTLSGDWEWGTPSNVGPSACPSGSCIGLRMSSDYNNNLNWSWCTATSPPIDLTGTNAPVLQFWSWLASEGSVWDGGNLKVSVGGPSFTTVMDVNPPYNLSNVQGQQAWGDPNFTSGWELWEADLSAFAGQTIRLQFAFRSDGSVTHPGWYIDDLTILD